MDTLKLSLNIDGVPLFKSSNISAWPILCCIDNLSPEIVFPIAFVIGKSKPSNLDFLVETIDDLNKGFSEGLQFEGIQFKISLTCIICDAPARAMVKNHKQYSGYFGCDRCTQRGLYVGRMTFPLVDNVPPRTDDAFRKQDQEGHHKGETPLLKLENLDIINDFPLDYMHLVCLGVIKRLILIWMRGPRREGRLSAGQIGQVSSSLIELRRFIPRNFARKPRGLDELDRWKATEFRQFLLYTGQFVMKSVLPDEHYKHFMTLSTAVCLLVGPALAAKHAEYAHQLIKYFVKRGATLYGPEFMVYNVHGLIHLADDASRFSGLDNCAAWKFENYMQQLKRKVRTGKNPAVQLVKRTIENSSLPNVGTCSASSSTILCKQPDNAYLTTSGKYCTVVRKMVDRHHNIIYLCRVYHSPLSIHSYPCDSQILGFCKMFKADYQMKNLQADEIKSRCILIDNGNTVTFLPLLHKT